MTREEAINKAINIVVYFEAHFAKSKEAREEAINIIEALEQEPCEDVISRKNTLKAMIEQLGIRNEDYLLPAEETLYKVVKNAPPVTPQQKMGHWIENRAKNYPGWIHCSECGEDWTHDGRPPYCPACGARMRKEK